MPTSLPAPAHAFGNLLAGAFVMPIIRIEQRASAVPLARALVAGGVRVFEVLLRTPCALDAIADIRTQVPEATVGAGTLLGAADVANALAAGAQFAVTPGLTPELAQAVVRHRLPTLPGVATASEVMQAMSLGFDALKLFPAHGLWGASQIEALQGVFPSLRFCPTGGIKPEHIATYLALRGCGGVGGSWVTPERLIAQGDWDGITVLARQAASFRRP